MNYIFPMETSSTPPKNAGLAEMRAFLRYPEDGFFLDVLIKYELPASYEIKRFDDGSAFMCIEIELSGQIGEIDIAKLPPRIAAIMGKGIDSEWEPPSGFTHDPTEIVKKALASDDVFVIYGNTGLPRLFSDLVSGILGPETASFPDISLDEYKNQLLAKLGTKNELTSKFETAYDQFNRRALTHEDALKILGEIYTAVLEIQDDKSFYELRKIVDILGQGGYGIRLGENTNWRNIEKNNRQKIMRHIYSLPHNRIKYEDNGKIVLADTIDRLGEVVSTQEEELLLNNLRKLEGDETLDETWFDELANTRKQLMLAFLAPQNPFILGELKEQIMDILSKYKQSNAAVKGSSPNKSIFAWYIEHITMDNLNKYRRPFDGTLPFLCGGVCIVDMDACADEIAIGEAFCKSKKIIVLGSQMTGLFRSVLLGANTQSAVDRKPRIAFCGMNSPNVKRIWYYPEKLVIVDFVRQNSEKVLSFGILTSRPRPDLASALESSDIGSIVYKIGSLRDLYYDVFDVLIWFFESGEEDHMLSSAYVRVSDTLVFVGDPNGLAPDSSLLQIYNTLTEDDIYGK